jgi:hypothetical protein
MRRTFRRRAVASTVSAGPVVNTSVPLALSMSATYIFDLLERVRGEATFDIGIRCSDDVETARSAIIETVGAHDATDAFG